MISRATLSGVVAGQQKFRSMLAGNTAFSPASFESIATLNGTGSSGILTFTSIPQTYKHLHIRGVVRNTASGTTTSPVEMRFNSAGGYSKHRMYADGTSEFASGNAGVGNIYVGQSPNNGVTGARIGVFYVDIYDYTSTTKYKVAKSFSGVNNNGNGTNMTVDFWSGAINNSLTAVTSLEFGDDNGYNFSTLTQISLYGIKG
jgi:hypothetical protein